MLWPRNGVNPRSDTHPTLAAGNVHPGTSKLCPCSPSRSVGSGEAYSPPLPHTESSVGSSEVRLVLCQGDSEADCPVLILHGSCGLGPFFLVPLAHSLDTKMTCVPSGLSLSTWSQSLMQFIEAECQSLKHQNVHIVMDSESTHVAGYTPH